MAVPSSCGRLKFPRPLIWAPHGVGEQTELSLPSLHQTQWAPLQLLCQAPHLAPRCPTGSPLSNGAEEAPPSQGLTVLWGPAQGQARWAPGRGSLSPSCGHSSKWDRPGSSGVLSGIKHVKSTQPDPEATSTKLQPK